MIHSKKIQKIASLILCFVIFFSLGNVVNADLGEKSFNDVYDLMLSQLTETLLSLEAGSVTITVSLS